jgi:hypothetical protein
MARILLKTAASNVRMLLFNDLRMMKHHNDLVRTVQSTSNIIYQTSDDRYLATKVLFEELTAFYRDLDLIQPSNISYSCTQIH